MEKVCNNWPKEAFIDKLIDARFWEPFEEHAKMASAEIFRVKDYDEAAKTLDKLIKDLNVNKVIAVGGDDNPNLKKVYDGIAASGIETHTDKFEIAEHCPTADLGISFAEFGVAETGSVVVDLLSFEARVTSMLPPYHVVFLNSQYVTENVTTAFQMIARVFDKGYMGFITGPSRTADIERVLSLGVHGPSRFFILALDGEGSAN